MHNAPVDGQSVFLVTIYCASDGNEWTNSQKLFLHQNNINYPRVSELIFINLV